MTFLLENPWPTLLMGGLTLAILVAGWYQTGHRGLVIALVSVLAIVIGLVALEATVVTDREALEATIHQIGREAKANDIPALQRHFHSRRNDLRQRLATEMVAFDVKEVSIKNNLKVDVKSDRTPKTAVATFNVVVTVSDASGSLKDFPVPRFITADFELENGLWRCTGYEHDVPQRETCGRLNEVPKSKFQVPNKG